MGGGFISVETALIKLLEEAQDEVLIVAYTISEGAKILFEQLENVLQRGVRLKIIVNRFAEQNEEARKNLLMLATVYPTLFRIYSFVPDTKYADLHAKIVVADRKCALIGSANLSLRGLLRNHELAVVIEGTAAKELARAIDLLGQSLYSHLQQY